MLCEKDRKRDSDTEQRIYYFDGVLPASRHSELWQKCFMRKAGISPASLGQEDWKAVFNGGIILPGGRKLMAVREPAGYGMRISDVSPGSARESGMEM